MEPGHALKRRFYDVVGFSDSQRIEKLRYMARHLSARRFLQRVGIQSACITKTRAASRRPCTC
jgi:hypothetical protein